MAPHIVGGFLAVKRPLNRVLGASRLVPVIINRWRTEAIRFYTFAQPRG